MLVTEAGAAEKWCHRFADPGDVDHSRTRCIGSSCMAWRWSDPALTNEPEHVRRPMGDCRRGYCGLVGKPETMSWRS